jgi:hypothetical protein
MGSPQKSSAGASEPSRPAPSAVIQRPKRGATQRGRGTDASAQSTAADPETMKTSAEGSAEVDADEGSAIAATTWPMASPAARASKVSESREVEAVREESFMSGRRSEVWFMPHPQPTRSPQASRARAAILGIALRVTAHGRQAGPGGLRCC